MVTISTAAPLQSVALPTEAQLDELQRLVPRRLSSIYPSVHTDRGNFRRQFGFATFYRCHVRRVPEPQTGFYFSFWSDDCQQFLDRYDQSMSQRGYSP